MTIPYGPKVQPMPAQGNALGIRLTKVQALKERNKILPSFVPPIQGYSVNACEPRAMPWAGMGWTFGPRTESCRALQDSSHSFRSSLPSSTW